MSALLMAFLLGLASGVVGLPYALPTTCGEWASAMSGAMTGAGYQLAGFEVGDAGELVVWVNPHTGARVDYIITPYSELSTRLTETQGFELDGTCLLGSGNEAQVLSKEFPVPPAEARSVQPASPVITAKPLRASSMK